MHTLRPGRLVAVSAALLWLGHGGATVHAQSISPARPAAGAPAAAVAVVSGEPTQFRPSMGDLMTLLVQPRHTKLGLAGARRNWAYALYELGELRNALGRTSRTVPLYNGADMAAAIAQFTRVPLQDLEQAVRAGSATQFSRAYRTLTAACNACHAAQGHAAVVIRVPDAGAFPDQDFAPQRH